jgi:hypothetical protein
MDSSSTTTRASQLPRVEMAAVKGLHSQEATAQKALRCEVMPWARQTATISHAAAMSAAEKSTCSRRGGAISRAGMAAGGGGSQRGLGAEGEGEGWGAQRAPHLAAAWPQPDVGQHQVRQERAVAVGAAQEGRLALRHVARRVREHAVVDVRVLDLHVAVLELAVGDQGEPERRAQRHERGGAHLGE